MNCLATKSAFVSLCRAASNDDSKQVFKVVRASLEVSRSEQSVVKLVQLYRGTIYFIEVRIPTTTPYCPMHRNVLTSLPHCHYRRRSGWSSTRHRPQPRWLQRPRINLFPNATRLFQHWGLLDALYAFSHEIESASMLSYRGDVLSSAPLGAHLRQKWAAPYLVVHRVDLHELLYAEAQKAGATIVLGAEANSITTSIAGEPSVLTFANGTEFSADLIVGADGERSAVRTNVVGQPSVQRDSGDHVYRMVIPSAQVLAIPNLRHLVEKPRTHLYVGPGGNALTYTLKRDGLLNVVLSMKHDKDDVVQMVPTRVPQDAILAEFSEWQCLHELLKLAEGGMKWTLLETEAASTWVGPQKNVVLMGDAAHSMMPYLGQGAAMALEDAAVLGELLGRIKNRDQIGDVVTMFESVRQPRALEMRRRSGRMREMYGMENGARQEERDRQLREGDGWDGFANFLKDPVLVEWMFRYDAVTEADTAWKRYVKGEFPGTSGLGRNDKAPGRSGDTENICMNVSSCFTTSKVCNIAVRGWTIQVIDQLCQNDIQSSHRTRRISHPDDLDRVISRAQAAGVQKMMVTGSDLTESRNAIRLAEEYPGLCFATVGVHPCSAKTFEQFPQGPDALLAELKQLAQQSEQAGTTAAFGEIGLDYDRLHYCDKETQITYFEKQLDLAIELQMPLFLHSRAAAEDFERILKARLDRLPKRGLVHSFTGTHEEMQSLVALGFDIGVNGCSLKTEENLAVVAEVPLERLQIETDGPWCEMRPSHASAKYCKHADTPELPKAVKKEKWNAEAMVKGRNEPCTIARVAWVVAKVKGVTIEEICEQYVYHGMMSAGSGISTDDILVHGATQFACSNWGRHCHDILSPIGSDESLQSWLSLSNMMEAILSLPPIS
nr:deoxyribonuclease tat-d [Quercus suber]